MQLFLDMKMLSRSHVSDSIDQLTTATSHFIEDLDSRIKTGYQSIAHYVLFPQAMAGYTGLKKLIEKDYHDHEDIKGSLVSS